MSTQKSFWTELQRRHVIRAAVAHVVFFSLLGIVALSGVVVNSSLVLVDYINKQRKLGRELTWALSHAGAVRFRPIILTSITTFVGLSPMMLDNTASTIMFAPMAVSLAFGVLLGTAVTLLLVPCLYMILEDFLILTGMHTPDDEQNETLQTGYEAA